MIFLYSFRIIQFHLGVYYAADKVFLETDLRHKKFDSMRMSPALLEHMEEQRNPLVGPDAVSLIF